MQRMKLGVLVPSAKEGELRRSRKGRKSRIMVIE